MGFDRFAQLIAGGFVTYSYTQLAQYLACPLRYRYRYLDGWQEKKTRAGLLFGRAFEQAQAALFRREDPGDAEPYGRLHQKILQRDGWGRRPYTDAPQEAPLTPTCYNLVK